MKAVDTNILIRLLVGDDSAQGRKVKTLFQNIEASGTALFISIPVLLETIWVLESSYSCPREKILNAIEQLTLMPCIRFEAPERVQEMIQHARDIKIELSDLLIGLTARDAGCDATLTFDKDASKSSLFEFLD